MKDSSFNKSSSDEKKEEVDSDKRHKEKQEETDIYKPRLFVFQLELGDYLYTIREIGSFSVKKHECL